MTNPFTPRLRWLSIVAVSTVFLAGCATGPSSDASATLGRADKALGAGTVQSLRFAGNGTGGIYGQAWVPGAAWPRITYSNFARVYDYETAALREDFARSRAEPNGGGALPLMGTGEQRATALVQGAVAWNLAGPAPVPAPVALDGRIHDLWTSPHGVLKAATRNKATGGMRTVDGVVYSTLSFTEPGRFSAVAYVNAAGLVERVDSVQPHPAAGDTDTVTLYADYKDHGGVKFPGRIRQSQGGHPVLDIAVSEVQVNAPSGIQTPELARTFAERATTEKVADGVWFVAGGSHNSVAIEFKDHLVLVESPLYDGRAGAVLAEVKKLAPGKPIRYVINSHHHFDHSGGLRAAVADGATLITSTPAKPFFEKTLANPNRINPDLLARSGRTATVEAVGGKRVLTDGERTVEIHEIQGSVHAQGFNLVYLPREKLIVQADAYTPGPPNSPPPAQPNGNHVNLVANIERLQLSVDRILPLHGRVVPVAELLTAIGRK